VTTIETVRLGRRVLTWLEGEVGYAASVMAPGTAFVVERHHLVSLRQERVDGNWCEADLLRSLEWLASQGITKTGDRTVLDLPEMGVSGVFQVMAIGPCPEIDEGPGRVVTARFRHGWGRVYNVWVEGESVPLGATDRHPFWSTDRLDWVSVSELRVGEWVQVAGQTARVLKIEECGYRVGEQGILVHNQSEVCNPAAGEIAYDPVKTVTFTDASGNSVSGEVGTGVIAYMTPSSVRPPGDRVDLDEPSWWSKLQAVAGGPIQLGHIFASTLGGTGKKSWNNLTPLYQKANTPAMRTCEGFLKRLVTECHYCVTVHVQVEGYGQNMSVPAAARPAMPTRVVIDWTNDCGTQKGTFVIDNTTTAAAQDPCRVANLPCRP
jgi:hypothetical protein